MVKIGDYPAHVAGTSFVFLHAYLLHDLPQYRLSRFLGMPSKVLKTPFNRYLKNE